MPDSLDLSLVIACYNEEPLLKESVRQIFETLDHTVFTYELIFVDDVSRDRTRALIDEIIQEHPGRRLRRLFHAQNTGRGGAVSDGLRLAQGTVAGYIDIDLEVHARNIPPLVIAVRNGADIATGLRIYRFQIGSTVRFILSKGYQWMVRRLLNVPGLTDTETGFKFFNRERILPVLDECEDQRWFWDTEIMVRSALRGYRIVEIPVLFLRRFDKQSSVNVVQDTLDYFRKFWRFRRQLQTLRRAGAGAPPPSR